MRFSMVQAMGEVSLNLRRAMDRFARSSARDFRPSKNSSMAVAARFGKSIEVDGRRPGRKKTGELSGLIGNWKRVKGGRFR